ncbi:hypothetical protein AVEN_32093-1 [Araneus ventricosus]|uniref:Uncharacterized protein n=1 Tax=Araneus ventricosus TaxID=182803 RepID=A0A4Y2EG39_ARAVE|nr:hypothetical protein AVEN_32093-1 [Araneus ventricosus]
MPYGPANLIDAPYGQFVYNYTQPRKSVCCVAFKHIARGQDDLTEARTEVKSIMSPYGNTVREKNGMDFIRIERTTNLAPKKVFSGR